MPVVPVKLLAQGGFENKNFEKKTFPNFPVPVKMPAQLAHWHIGLYPFGILLNPFSTPYFCLFLFYIYSLYINEMKYCPNCSYDLSALKQKPEQVEEPKEEIIKVVKVREPSKKQAEHLKKAREAKQKKQAEKKTPKEEPQQPAQPATMFLF